MFKVSENLDEQLMFSNTVFKIAKSFVSLEGINTILNEALKNLGEVCNAGRSYIFLFRNNLVMDNTHEWCAKGVSPQIHNLKNLPLNIFPWWMEKLKNHELINIEDTNLMPDEANAEKEILQQQNIKSIIVLGLYREYELIGFIGLDNITSKHIWENSVLEYLKVASNILSSALQREEKNKKILEQNKKLNTINDKLAKALNQLVQNEKMKAIGQLAAGMAHEINNPMGFINSNFIVMQNYFKLILHYTEILKKTPEKAKLFWEENDIDFIVNDVDSLFIETDEGIKRVINIVNNLKMFSNEDDNFCMMTFDVNLGLKSIISILEKSIIIEEDFNSTGEIKASDSLINQAFFNIILNSFHAVKQNPDYKKKKIKISTYNSDSKIIVEISDNGHGISKDILSKIFDPFFTTKDIGEGMGLGLYIAYDIIVNKNNGKLFVDSKVGSGTKFKIVLPKYDYKN